MGYTEAERTRRIISDWVLFHDFEDDCGYPLISPSDVVLDDLALRLAATGEPHEINKEARERWKTVPNCKGKERRLRRKTASHVLDNCTPGTDFADRAAIKILADFAERGGDGNKILSEGGIANIIRKEIQAECP